MSVLGSRKQGKRHTDLARIWFGNHAFSVLIIGNSRTGKTILLCRYMNDYIKLGNKNFINDCAKGFNHKLGVPESELMRYFSPELDAIHKIRVFVPPNCNIEIDDPKKELTKDFEVVQVHSYEEIFKRIMEGGNTINIISVDAFLLAPLAKARFWATFVLELQARCFPSRSRQTLTPIVGALDQANYIFPSNALRQSGVGKGIQDLASDRFASFMMDAAGNGVRMLATTHRIRVLKKSVRDTFLWNIFKNSSSDITDIAKRLVPAQKIIENLQISEMYVIDDSNKGDKVPGLDDLSYPNRPVYYEGKRIHDPFYMLESPHKIHVMTPQEMRDSKKSPDDLSFRRKRSGNMWLLGYDWETIGNENEISKRTVAEDMKWNRADHFFAALEPYRDYICKQEAKRIRLEAANLRRQKEGVET